MVQYYHHLSHQEVKALSKMMWLIKTRVIGCCCSLAQSYCKTKQSAKKSEIWSLLMTIGMQKCKTFYQLGFFFNWLIFKDKVSAAAIIGLDRVARNSKTEHVTDQLIIIFELNYLNFLEPPTLKTCAHMAQTLCFK